MNGVLVKSYPAPAVNYGAACRYAGGKKGDAALESALEECYAGLSGGLCYRVCYTELALQKRGELLDLSFAKNPSEDLKKMLDGCERILLFAATVGQAPDRMILRHMRLSPYKTLLFQAAGSERVEALCDLFCADMAREYGKKGFGLTPRFSPGYGDLPLSLQREVFAALMPERHLGVTLNESLLMSPSKSVTAIIGLRLKS